LVKYFIFYFSRGEGQNVNVRRRTFFRGSADIQRINPVLCYIIILYPGQSFMMTSPRPKTNKNLATKARRHKGFIYNKTFCVTLCLGVFVAIFIVGQKKQQKIKLNGEVLTMRVSNKKNAVWKVFFGVTVLLLFTMEASPAIYGNGGDKAWPPPPNGLGVTGSTMSLESGVINGAGYFLSSCSDFLLFLNKAELAGLDGADFEALNLSLSNAIANMELAKDVYVQLTQQMDVTPYDPVMIDKLLKFNYDLFQKKNNLIKPVFEEVKYYLESGAARELYGEILCQVDGILNIAYPIRAKIEANEFPGLLSLWELQQGCCKSMLFGQYAARVFLNLNE
jgi:hypothetical protein